MPKKISTNPKAVEARARKEEQKKTENERKEREKEDLLWQDDDKMLQRKTERKAAEERKKQQQLESKQLKQALYEQEMGVEKKSKSESAAAVPKKITRAEIERETERKRAEELKKRNINSQQASDVDLLTENVNHLTVEGEVGRTVDEALAILTGSAEELDKHPEKRLKAAYAAYEEAQLPIVKAENPNMRLSQLKQMIRKDWNKSPDNPLNRPNAALFKK